MLNDSSELCLLSRIRINLLYKKFEVLLGALMSIYIGLYHAFLYVSLRFLANHTTSS